MKNVPHDFEVTHEAPLAVLQGARSSPRQAHPDWIYFLPILHFCACLMSTLRFFVPGLQYLSVMWDSVVHVDFPVSLVAEALAPKFSALAAIWIVVAGTLWWYLLSRAAETLFYKFATRKKPVSA
ncbi:MAG: hypothetical protein WCF88_02990 [Candidatus Acidiferrales bacterium]|jgi:hypothetical protein